MGNNTYTKIFKGCHQDQCPDNFPPPPYDMNNDGLGDLVTAECHKEGKQEVCDNYQVRLGLQKGGYLDLYDLNAPHEPVRPGDTVYDSAKSYADNPNATKYLGEPIPYSVRILGPHKPRLLSSDELTRRCEAELKNPDQIPARAECIEQAETGPADHIFQPHSSLEPMVYFEAPKPSEDKKVNLPNPAGPVPPDHLVKEDAIRHEIFAKSGYDFLDLGKQLTANIIARVKDGTTTDLGDYLFAFEQKAITAEEFVGAIINRWSDLHSLLVKPTHKMDDREKNIAGEVKKIILEATEKSPELKAGLFEMIIRWERPLHRTYEALSLAHQVDPEKAGRFFRVYLASSRIDDETKKICRELLADEDPTVFITYDLIHEIQKTITSDHPLVLIPRSSDDRKAVGEGLRTKANRLVAILVKRDLTPEQTIAVLDLLYSNRALIENEEEEIHDIKPLSDLLNATFQKADFLIPLVDYLLEVTRPANWCDIRWQRRLEKVTSNLTRLLAITIEPGKIPSVEKLLTLADRIVATRGAVVIASAHKLPGLDEPLATKTAEKLEVLFREQLKALSPKDRLSAVIAAREIYGNDAVVELVQLTRYTAGGRDGIRRPGPEDWFDVVVEVKKDKKSKKKEKVVKNSFWIETERIQRMNEEAAEIRLKAYQALAPFLGPDKTKVDPKDLSSVIERFHAALEDEAIRIRIFAAQILIDSGDPYVARQLSRQLAAYVQPQAQSVAPEHYRASLAAYYTVPRSLVGPDHPMEKPVAITLGNGTQFKLTLKALAFQAIFRFADNQSVRDEMTSILDAFSLPVLRDEMDRLQRERKEIMRRERTTIPDLVPDGVRQLAIAIYQRGIEEFSSVPPETRHQWENILSKNFPFLYNFMASQNPEIHRQTVIALRSANSLSLLASLLSDLQTPQEFARREAARALETYQEIAGEEFAKDLTEVSESQEVEAPIRQAAAERLTAFRAAAIPTR